MASPITHVPWHSGCHDGWWAGSGLSPMDQNRYFLPIRPIHVAAMSLRGLLGPHGLDVLASECIGYGFPALS